MSQSPSPIAKKGKVLGVVLIGIVFLGCGFYVLNPARTRIIGRKLLGRPTQWVGRVNRELCGIGGGMLYYQATFKEPPAGSNADVAKALLGENPEKRVFVLWRNENLNEAGEFIDPWRTPYDIRISSNGDIFIRSAGEDRVLGTRDDLDGTQ